MNKIKFIMLYFGQSVLGEKHFPVVTSLISLKNISGDIGNLFLKLKPLSLISDEDVIEVAKLVSYRYRKHFEENSISFEKVKNMLEVVIITNNIPVHKIQITSDGIDYMAFYPSAYGDISHYCPNQYAVTDYLRSKGYAISWMGMNVNEMVEAGWIKLVS